MKKRKCTIRVAKTKALISFAVTADLRLCFRICRLLVFPMRRLIYCCLQYMYTIGQLSISIKAGSHIAVQKLCHSTFLYRNLSLKFIINILKFNTLNIWSICFNVSSVLDVPWRILILAKEGKENILNNCMYLIIIFMLYTAFYSVFIRPSFPWTQFLWQSRFVKEKYGKVSLSNIIFVTKVNELSNISNLLLCVNANLLPKFL